MKKISFSLLLCSVFLCTTSCSLEYKPITPLETHIDVVEDGYYRNSEYSESYENIYLQKPKALDESLTSQMYYKFRYLPSTGNQKILVIPVEFSDYPASSSMETAVFDGQVVNGTALIPIIFISGQSDHE